MRTVNNNQNAHFFMMRSSLKDELTLLTKLETQAQLAMVNETDLIDDARGALMIGYTMFSIMKHCSTQIGKQDLSNFEREIDYIYLIQLDLSQPQEQPDGIIETYLNRTYTIMELSLKAILTFDTQLKRFTKI